MLLKIFYQVFDNLKFSAPKVIKSETNWTQKKDFGKVPDYLSKIKDNISTEY